MLKNIKDHENGAGMGGTDEPDMYKRGCGGKTTGHTEMSVGNRPGGKYGAGYRQVAETAGDLPDFYNTETSFFT
jgi:hypothetical protein